MDYKQQVVQALAAVLGDELTTDTINKLVEQPKSDDLGDYAFPTFALAKVRRMAPPKIAADIVAAIDQSQFDHVVAQGAYVNFFLDKVAFAQDTLTTIATQGSHYGDAQVGHGNVPIDMSSPNIAKPMSMGHLRSTVIGNSLAKILTKIGYTPIKINYLGDWGTQFGKLIVAYKKMG